MEKFLKGDLFYEKVKDLKPLNADFENWKVYYLDEFSGEKWVEEYLYSELHGGGPPQLRKVENFPWEPKVR